MVKLKQSKQQLAMPDRRLKALVSTNAPWSNSGYGTFAKDLLSRLRRDNWQVSLSAFYGLDGSPINYTDPPFDKASLYCYPKMAHPFGSDALLAHSRHYGANVSFTFQDAWSLDDQHLAQLKERPVWIPILPVDQAPVPPNLLQKLPYAYKIITISRFGQQALEKAGFSSTLIVEGTDINVFKPMDKAASRAFFGLPADALIVGMVGANKPDGGIPRKGWQEALDAFKMFHDKHPEAIFFYESNQIGGFPIKEYASMLGIGKAIFHMDEYISIFHAGSDVMAKMYNAFDFTLMPSTTEGFGLCCIESMACGTPVIVNRCTSMPEMIVENETGLICEVSRKHLSPAMGYVYFADTYSLYQKMEEMYSLDRDLMGMKARDYVIENYNIDTQYEKYWKPLFTELQQELCGLPKIDELKLAHDQEPSGDQSQTSELAGSQPPVPQLTSIESAISQPPSSEPTIT